MAGDAVCFVPVQKAVTKATTQQNSQPCQEVPQAEKEQNAQDKIMVHCATRPLKKI